MTNENFQLQVHILRESTLLGAAWDDTEQGDPIGFVRLISEDLTDRVGNVTYWVQWVADDETPTTLTSSEDLATATAMYERRIRDTAPWQDEVGNPMQADGWQDRDGDFVDLHHHRWGRTDVTGVASQRDCTICQYLAECEAEDDARCCDQ